MGKTIALKLSKREEQIIAQFNEKGMTNSELLRSALRQYVQNMPEFSSDDALIKNIFVKQEDVQTDFFDSVKELKSDMQGLQEQLVNTQKKVESEIEDPAETILSAYCCCFKLSAGSFFSET